MAIQLLFTGLIILLGHLGCAREGNPYSRIHDGALQIASKTFVASAKPKVTLLGAVHIGEKSYYQQLQKQLDNADVVLFEGIGTDAEIKEIKKKCPEMKSKGGGHEENAKLLKLECQTKNIRKQSHFVHADMSMDELLDHKGIEMGKPLCERLRSSKPKVKSSATPPKGEAEKMRNTVALSLIKDMSHEREFARQEHILILFKRNKLVMETLKTELPKYKEGQEVIIFYGAGHMPDLELSLQDMGYSLDASSWISAFSL